MTLFSAFASLSPPPLSLSLSHSCLSDNILANDSFRFMVEGSHLGIWTGKNNRPKCQVSAYLSNFFFLSFCLSLCLQNNNAPSLSPLEVYDPPKQTDIEGHKAAVRTREKREIEGLKERTDKMKLIETEDKIEQNSWMQGR